MNGANSAPLLALPIGIRAATLARKSPKATPTSTPKTPTSTSKIEPEEAGEVGEEKCAGSSFTVGAAFFDQVLDCSENRDPLGILREINERIADRIDYNFSWIPSIFTRLVQQAGGLKFTRARFDASCKEPNTFMLQLTPNYGDPWDAIRVTVESEATRMRIRFKAETASKGWSWQKKLQKNLVDEYAPNGVLVTYTNLRNIKKQVRPH